MDAKKKGRTLQYHYTAIGRLYNDNLDVMCI